MPNFLPSDALRSDPCSGSARAIHSTLYLDYGVDSVSGDDAACEVCSRGMRFRSRWRFEIGTVIRIAFSLDANSSDPAASPERLNAEAMVVDCSPDETDTNAEIRLLTTLAFVEPPESLTAALGKVSARLFLS